MADLATVTRNITNELITIPGLSEARNTAIEKAPGFPLLMVYPRSGFWRNGSAAGGRSSTDNAMRWGTWTINCVVHVARRDLPYDIAAAIPFADSVPNKLMVGYHRDRFGGSIVCLSDPTNRGSTAPLSCEFGPSAVGAQETVAWTFALDVTVEEEIT